ncbi:UDP-glucose 4-epimerase [Streptoalloteichus tenebrarius]|uniref:UDP-glucose 4-epimerase n=1 Tax=Streptoalloteichus tenebrarius (strain ATCC 17920 / DSM 40477 / JCM 4838 / CBS 697.72 / NBRC 16177 / NCIMB 11028 / NRRL B-12390 / A12253. 1 / ISP 5477) TaxID=1933 RepID=A0ABT1I1L4_STRSD|nr:UDP-glucose 4-epimerase GalE [Streptoalloteichus tenebrarius]MCP2261623.1 UDP-glucose 4-epimerase [Streptoalloteichus tenebrarius]BFE99375.1 UDP-glucose 4-epimerase GalE [Streptoalloteichus tenebrarius]
MRLLVTGGAGYVGSVVAHQLLSAGHQVVVLDDLSSGYPEAVPDGADLVVGGMAEAARLFAERGPFDGVVHLAARSLIDDSVRHPERYWHGNTVQTLALLDAMREAGVPRIVVSSTAATYGQPSEIPISETSPTVPTNPYGDSKLAVDLMLAGYARAHGIAAISLRYFNVAGAVGRHGERHDPETHVIPLALRSSLGEGPDFFPVFGADYPTPDGTCVRDFVHVADIANAHLAALDRARSGEHRVYNLGNGKGFSVLEVLDAVAAVTGRPVPRRPADRRPGDPAVLVASGERARRELGWRPARPTLEEMISDAYRFHRDAR